jgi:indolepyruvate ferredoxin oxidoreductase beta subunit
MTVFPPETMDIVRAGVEQCLDWQDATNAELYVSRLKAVLDLDRAIGDGAWRLTKEAGRQLALAMTYEDTIRVADLKIRASRFQRVADEAGVKPGQLLEIREFLHPRLQEIAETVPAPLGRFLLKPGFARRAVERLTAEGKVLETTSVRGFLQLYMVAGLKQWRRKNLRYAAEQESIEGWLKLVMDTARRDYTLGVEAAELRTLVKGYGDTHERGSKNFAAITAVIPRLSGPAAAKTLAELRKAAVADDTGAKLKAALAGLS